MGVLIQYFIFVGSALAICWEISKYNLVYALIAGVLAGLGIGQMYWLDVIVRKRLR